MRKTFVIPMKYARFVKHRERYHGKMLMLSEMLEAELGFETRFVIGTNDFPFDSDLILLYGEPNALGFMPSVLDSLRKEVSLVGIFSDIHWHKPTFLPRLFDRCSVILSISHTVFERFWPNYIEKFIYFPTFFAPHDNYVRLSIRDNPKMKCLLSGQTRTQYPIRSYLRLETATSPHVRSMIDILEHPRKDCKLFFTRNNPCEYEYYPETLNEYFCCITDDGMPENTQVVAKYFEIPAAGSLLLAPIASDLKFLDFTPNVHFVPITKGDALSKVKGCLDNPETYYPLRKAGMEMVRQKHSINNRFAQLKVILEGSL